MVKKLVNIHGSVPSRVILTSRGSCTSKDGRQDKKKGDGIEFELNHWKQRNVLWKNERKVEKSIFFFFWLGCLRDRRRRRRRMFDLIA